MTSSTQTRARARHLGPERRRPLVLDAAFSVFLERGYEGTSMEAIAETAGVTKPVVYACYASKDDLFRALFRREEERILAEIGSAIREPDDPDDVEGTLVEGFTALLRAVARSPRAYRFIFLGEGGASAAAARRIRRGREIQVETLADLARRWLEARGEAADDAEARLIAHAIVALAEAGARTLLSDSGTWTPQSLGRALARFAAAGQTGV